jgi:5'-3' exonuclease
MGIPFYFRKLVLTFGNQLISKVQHIEECDCFYLDFNSMIHQSANEVIKLHPNLETHQHYYPLIISHIIDSIINILNVVRPSKKLYIAIDGPCPRAKMQQQRKRRYMTIWRKQKTVANSCVWDSNVITPGTDFMTLLDSELELFINKNKNTLTFDIILSKSSEFGEGEHKIFEVIKPGETTIIYGLDADLIMLSLISKNYKNIRLLRESQHFSNNVQNANVTFSFLDIGNLHHLISCEHNMPVSDYVMLCVLLGNDFLPPLSYLSMRKNGIETIVSAYHECKDFHHTLLVANNDNLNIKFFGKIFNLLAATEDDCMNEACDMYYSKCSNDKSNIDYYPQYTKCNHIINPSNDLSWRHTYYTKIVKASVKSSCIEYVKGLLWIFDYYFKKDACYHWYYPFSYSPSIKDIHIEELVTQINNSKKQSKIQENLQLLLVLPPQSAHLLVGKSAQNLVKNIEHGIYHLYPKDFQILTFLKTYLWECTPVLPDIDIEIIQSKLKILESC